MKIISTMLVSILMSYAGWGQLKATALCPPFVVDVLEGNINQLHPKSTQGEIKKMFPCESETVETGSETKCAGVFYKDKGIYFYTERNYFEINDQFKGKLTLPLIGATRSSLFNSLGYPKIKDATWDAFQMKYGTLVVYYNAANKIIKIQISSRSTETLKLCE